MKVTIIFELANGKTHSVEWTENFCNYKTWTHEEIVDYALRDLVDAFFRYKEQEGV